MNLIILRESDRRDAVTFTLSDERAVHIRTILKCSQGDSLEVGMLNGPTGVATIVALDDRAITLACENWHPVLETEAETDIICALPRPQTFKKVLSTCATMDVRRLDFIRANRVEKSFFQSPVLESESIESFLIEGLSQGKRTRMPEVAVHDRFRIFFEETLPSRPDSDQAEARLVAHPETTRTLQSKDIDPAKRVVIAIGPEGGWVPFELELMQTLGFRLVNLSGSILRVETAVTAALAQLELVRMS